MAVQQTMEVYEIDAAGQSLGRVASAAARALRGKDSPHFAPHRLAVVQVRIKNAGQLKLEAKKLKTKSYKRYSGYPGGLKETTLARLIEKKGVAEPLRRAIRGMLPANKLRPRLLKFLIIDD